MFKSKNLKINVCILFWYTKHGIYNHILFDTYLSLQLGLIGLKKYNLMCSITSTHCEHQQNFSHLVKESFYLSFTFFISWGFSCSLLFLSVSLHDFLLKFSFSEKATKMWSYHPLDLTFTK